MQSSAIFGQIFAGNVKKQNNTPSIVIIFLLKQHHFL